MALTVVYSSAALRDLSAIRDYLIARSPAGADKVRNRIIEHVEMLANFPSAGIATPDPEIRLSPLGRYPYRIYYAEENGALVVLHIRHTARIPIDPAKLKR